MDGRLWKNLKQRLRFNCCFSGSSPGMNLAAALAAGRSQNQNAGPKGEEELKSLMRLFEETETETKGWDGESESETEQGKDRVCCVCMVRMKGAAFIPCGHTFCRVCSKEVWSKRECCPLCNRLILHILNIF